MALITGVSGSGENRRRKSTLSQAAWLVSGWVSSA